MVTMEEIKAVLADTLSMSIDELDDSIPLEGGVIESLGYVEMLLAIEAQYAIRASDDELNDLKNIGDLTQLIFRKNHANYQDVFQK
jgi:acyl carrier protein